jgi:Tol biopolymer transport system component/uncharacterized RDD family membrane protein YckC
MRMSADPEPPSHSTEDVVGRRISAALIDLALLAGVFVFLALLIGESEAVGGSISVSLDGTGVVLYVALALLYYFVLETVLGQTVGKLLVGLRVVGADGGRPSPSAVAIRTLLRVADWLPLMYLVGFITMMATGLRRRRLGDLAAGTSLARAPVRHRTLALTSVALLALSIVGLTAYRAADSGGATDTEAARAARPGGRIAFATNRGCPDINDERLEIFVMNADGSEQTNLTNTGAAETSPAWSPDGTKIAFERSPTNFPPSEIFVMNVDGSDLENLTKSPASDMRPTWSPDRKRIAFERDRTDAGPFDIYVMNADGSGQRNLTRKSPGQNFSPAWSPDGTRIAYVRSAGPEVSPELYVMNADGSDQTNLTDNPAADDSPAWSADGRKIAFVSDRSTGDAYEIFVMNADGSGATKLTNTPDENEQSPSWSPDGTRIAFSRGLAPFTELFVMNADGSGQTKLTDNSANEYAPVWQPLPPSPPAAHPSPKQRRCH